MWDMTALACASHLQRAHDRTARIASMLMLAVVASLGASTLIVVLTLTGNLGL